MAEQIREEFEQYIKELTISISKEIYLEKLESLYLSGLQLEEKLELVLDNSAKEGEENRSAFCESIEEIVKFRQQIEEKLVKAEQAFEILNGGYEDTFQDFSAKVQVLNQEERKKFSYSLEMAVKNALNAIEQRYDLLNGHITEFHDAAQNIQAAMKGIDSGYQEIYDQYSKKIQEVNSKETQYHVSIISSKIEHLEKRLQTMEHTSKEEFAKLSDRIEKACKMELADQKQIIKSFTEQQDRIENSLNEKRKRTCIATSLYMVLGNSIIIALLSGILFLSKPWDMLNIGDKAIELLLVLSIVAYIIFGIITACIRAFSGRRKR